MALYKNTEPEKLKCLRDTFIETGLVPEEVHNFIARSWKRCKSKLNLQAKPRFVYSKAMPISRSFVQQSFLNILVRPLLEDIYEYIEGSEIALILIDTSNKICEIIGDAGFMEVLATIGYKNGSVIDESIIGTNAFALALIEAVPIQVIGAEHFLAEYIDISEVAAPIYDPSGVLLGAIGLVCPVQEASNIGLGLVIAAAKAIENRLISELFTRESDVQLRDFHDLLDSIPDGILAWSIVGLITRLNTKGAEFLGLDIYTATGHPLADNFIIPKSLDEAIKKGLTINEVIIDFLVAGNNRSFICTFEIIRERSGAIKEYVLFLRPALNNAIPKTLDEIEKIALINALEQSRGKINEAAKILNIGRNTLSRKITKYNIKRSESYTD